MLLGFYSPRSPYLASVCKPFLRHLSTFPPVHRSYSSSVKWSIELKIARGEILENDVSFSYVLSGLARSSHRRGASASPCVIVEVVRYTEVASFSFPFSSCLSRRRDPSSSRSVPRRGEVTGVLCELSVSCYIVFRWLADRGCRKTAAHTTLHAGCFLWAQ